MIRSLFIFLSLISLALNAQLSLQVEPTTVMAGQSIRLMLTADSASQGEPDFSGLQNDFTIIGSDNSTSYTIINGQTSSIRQWLLVLRPKHTGHLIIPPLSIAKEQTAATAIDVTQAPVSDSLSSTPDTQQEVMLTAEVSNKTPYVNEEMIYTVKLYNRLQLLNPTYQAPLAADALIIPLGQSRSYQANRQGHTYSVEEEHYAIFPQKSGALSITPPEFNALVYNGLSSQVSIKAPMLPITVKAAPKGKTWLPAQNVLLRDAWDNNNRSLVQGSTVIRKVTIETVGLPAQLLQPLSFDGNSSFSVYANKPIEKNTLRDTHVVGTRTITLTYLFNKAGNIVIPAVSLPWFNTATGKQEIATLPTITFDIKAANALSLPETPTIEKATPMVVKSPLFTQANSAWWVAILFASAWLITLMLWWKPWQLFYKKGSAFYLKQLHAACLINDPESAKQALLQWASCQWPAHSILNLASIAHLVADEVLARDINQLAAVLYRSGKHHWQGRTLWQSMTQYRANVPTKPIKKKSLPPINPL